MANNGITRRHFFFGTLLAGLMPTGGWGSVPSLKLLGYKSPNERLNIGCIGAGGRAASDINGVSSENLVAFADPDSVRAAQVFTQYPNASKYADFRQLFDKEEKNIDAVTIAIPDHMHATAALWAMERGKHVYCEKPLTHTPWEARMLTEAAARYGVATQMGNQGYSNDGTRLAAEIIWSGEIGNVTEVHAWTNRPIWPQGMEEVPPPDAVPSTLDWDTWLGVAETRPYTSGGEAYRQEYRTQFGFYQPFNWRGFLDFGCGSIGDMACHILGAPNMALKLGSPTSVELVKQEGRNSLTFPKTTVTRFEFPAREGMSPVTVYWYDGQSGPAFWPKDIPTNEPLIGGPGSFGSTEGDGTGAANDAARAVASYNGSNQTASPLPVKPDTGDNGALFVGDKGYLTTDTYAARVRLLPASRNNDYQLPAEVLPRSPGHWRDWIRASKGGQPACSNFSVAGPFAEWILLATIATRFDGKLEWDAEKMRFSNNDEASKYIKPNFRKSWAQVWNGKKLNAA